MKKILITLSISLCCLIAFGQSFEGKIVYQNSFKSKQAGVTDEQFTSMLGTTLNYYIKGGDYKSETNGTFLLWQLYINKDNKLYSKMSNSEAVLWNDAGVANEEVISNEIHPAAVEILGYTCDELVLNCKSGVQKYYFSSKLPIDHKLFDKHQYGNWYFYLLMADAVPLKMTVDNAQFHLESVATGVTPMKLDNAMFRLPAGVKTDKSPY